MSRPESAVRTLGMQQRAWGEAKQVSQCTTKLSAPVLANDNHPDYHRVTDSVDRIEFPKMARIVELGCETARRVANLNHALVRDNLGPRTGKPILTRGRLL
jgi:hypothetical protein